MDQLMTSEQIRQIIQSLDELTDDKTGQNRRQLPRAKSQLMLQITPVGAANDQFTDVATLRDYSNCGIGITCIQPLTPNHWFLARWVKVDGLDMEAICRVVSCVQMEDGAYRIGAQFAKL